METVKFVNLQIGYFTLPVKYVIGDLSELFVSFKRKAGGLYVK